MSQMFKGASDGMFFAFFSMQTPKRWEFCGCIRTAKILEKAFGQELVTAARVQTIMPLYGVLQISVLSDDMDLDIEDVLTNLQLSLHDRENFALSKFVSHHGLLNVDPSTNPDRCVAVIAGFLRSVKKDQFTIVHRLQTTMRKFHWIHRYLKEVNELSYPHTLCSCTPCPTLCHAIQPHRRCCVRSSRRCIGIIRDQKYFSRETPQREPTPFLRTAVFLGAPCNGQGVLTFLTCHSPSQPL